MFKCECGSKRFEIATLVVRNRPVPGMICRDCGKNHERKDVLKSAFNSKEVLSGTKSE